MGERWRFETSGPDGQCTVFGVNIFDFQWERTGRRALVRDPLYGQEFKFTVYQVMIGGERHRFAAGEFSNCVWGFYTEEEEAPDLYRQALFCLKLILETDHPELENWIAWLETDLEEWDGHRSVRHHLSAYGGMGSFNDLPAMGQNHEYTFSFLKSLCYSFGRLYCRRETDDPGALAEQCLREVCAEKCCAGKPVNRGIAAHLRRGDLAAHLDDPAGGS